MSDIELAEESQGNDNDDDMYEEEDDDDREYSVNEFDEIQEENELEFNDEDDLEAEIEEEEEENDRRGVYSSNRKRFLSSRKKNLMHVFNEPEEEDLDLEMLKLAERSAEEYMQYVAYALEEEFGKVLVKLAAVRKYLPALVESHSVDSNSFQIIDRAVMKFRTVHPLISVFGDNLKAILSMSLEKYQIAFEILYKATLKFFDLFKDQVEECTWIWSSFVEMLRTLEDVLGFIPFLELASEMTTNNESGSRSEKVVTAESAAETFLRTVNDYQREFLHVKNPAVKRRVYLPVLLCRFRAALKTNRLDVIKTIMHGASRWFKEEDVHVYTMSSHVELLFFLARFNVFIESYAEALNYAKSAFRACPSEALHNKKCILRLLIPLQMHFCVYPSDELLKEYELQDQFVPLRNAVRTGDLGAFDDHMDQFFLYYANKGLVDLVLSLKIEVVFNFVRNCFKARQKLFSHDEAESRKLMKPFLEAALRAVRARDSYTELEIMILQLVYYGRIRGRVFPDKGLQFPSQKKPLPRFLKASSDTEDILPFLLFE